MSPRHTRRARGVVRRVILFQRHAAARRRPNGADCAGTCSNGQGGPWTGTAGSTSGWRERAAVRRASTRSTCAQISEPGHADRRRRGQGPHQGGRHRPRVHHRARGRGRGAQLGDDVVATRGPGDYFGEIALVANRPRTATVTAKTPMKVEVIGRREFQTMLHDNPSIATELLGVAADRLSRHRGTRSGSRSRSPPGRSRSSSPISRVRRGSGRSTPTRCATRSPATTRSCATPSTAHDGDDRQDDRRRRARGVHDAHATRVDAALDAQRALQRTDWGDDRRAPRADGAAHRRGRAPRRRLLRHRGEPRRPHHGRARTAARSSCRRPPPSCSRTPAPAMSRSTTSASTVCATSRARSTCSR